MFTNRADDNMVKFYLFTVKQNDDERNVAVEISIDVIFVHKRNITRQNPLKT